MSRYIAAIAAILLLVGLAPAAAAGSSSTTKTPTQKVVVVFRASGQKGSPRSAQVRAAVASQQKPVLSQLKSSGARHVVSMTAVDAVSATVTPAEKSALAAQPNVAEVVPDSTIQLPEPAFASTPSATTQSPAPSVGSILASPSTRSAPPCGTATNPELDPEALRAINATPADLGADDGAGVTVAVLADGFDPTNPDLQRNPAFASTGSAAGSPVITSYQDFGGAGSGAPTQGAEAFLDASAIAAQGNSVYDISNYTDRGVVPAGCDIKIVGAAPGADVMAMRTSGTAGGSHLSALVQSVNAAVLDGAKVINESFANFYLPTSAQDAFRAVDAAAVAAGVTVVAGTGDSGARSTVGSPASDPSVIGVGATTTYRSYVQTGRGGSGWPGANGKWADNNISNLSSGGVSQTGKTVDLVAPGDLNWGLCSTDVADYSDCYDDKGAPSPIRETGGTSESGPFVSAAAADVIGAYASTHGGTDPSPALVKQILTSTATDLDAPADQQGAGLLDVQSAIALAKSIDHSSASHPSGMLVSPSQLNVTQDAGAASTKTVTITNAGTAPLRVGLSTRQLGSVVAQTSGTFCMQPGAGTAACPANTGTFDDWEGPDVYQDIRFKVPKVAGASRLEFASDYHYQAGIGAVFVSLFAPDGTLAGYSLPQGYAAYSNVEVTDPAPGTWTAVLFTFEDGDFGEHFVSGPVQWQARTLDYRSGGTLSRSSLVINPGASATTDLVLAGSQSAGDTAQSLVVTTAGHTTTVPVTIRTLIPTTAGTGGTFRGELTGGNGRDSGPSAQVNTYQFRVLPGTPNVNVGVSMSTDPNDFLVAHLVDPNGQVVGYSSNYTLDSSGSVGSRFVDLYHVGSIPGLWTLVLGWTDPIVGDALTNPFTGTISFRPVPVSTDLPSSAAHPAALQQGQSYTYTVRVTNPGRAPEGFLGDPRLPSTTTLPLASATVDPSNITLPPAAGVSDPIFFVPTHTRELDARVTASVPVDFTLAAVSYDSDGDPSLSPDVPVPGESGTTVGDTATLTFDEPEITQGPWLIDPSEIGPFPASGAPTTSASVTLDAVTDQFDPDITTSTGDLMSYYESANPTYNPVYVPPGDTGTIAATITPTGAVGSIVKGTMYVDDTILNPNILTTGDELAAIPYTYKIAAP